MLNTLARTGNSQKTQGLSLFCSWWRTKWDFNRALFWAIVSLKTPSEANSLRPYSIVARIELARLLVTLDLHTHTTLESERGSVRSAHRRGNGAWGTGDRQRMREHETLHFMMSANGSLLGEYVDLSLSFYNMLFIRLNIMSEIWPTSRVTYGFGKGH